jgi:high-affinity iron transporter
MTNKVKTSFYIQPWEDKKVGGGFGMIQSFLISFREVFEAILVLGLAFAFLKKSGRVEYYSNLYLGSFIGIVFSIITVFLFESYPPGADDAARKIFEGWTKLIAAFFVATLVIWLSQAYDIRDIVQKSL